MKLILTVPAHAKFGNVANDPYVEGVRINTTIPVNLSLEDTLKGIINEAGNKRVWIDLKCRQLRITDYNIQVEQDKEIHHIGLSHSIRVNTPTEVWFDNGNTVATIDKVVNGRELIIPSSVERGVGIQLPPTGKIGLRRGMSVTILDKTLDIDGYLTQKDKEFVEAAKKVGLHHYLLSFVECDKDISDLLALDSEARILAKIESPKGLDFVREDYPKYRRFLSGLKGRVNLMAARGDLYLQVDRPDQIIDGCREIINADKRAVMASRILESCVDPNKIPKCQDLTDVYCSMHMGYRRFMVGDDVSRREDSLKAAIGLFTVLANKYDGVRP